MHPNVEHVVIRSDRTPMANLDRTASIYGVPVSNLCNETWFDAINDDAADRGITVMLEASMGNATLSERGVVALPELLRVGRVITWFELAIAIRRKGEIPWPAILWNSFRQWLPNWLYRGVLDWKYGALALASRWSALKDEQRRRTVVEAARESPEPRASERVLANEWTRLSDNGVTDRLAFLTADDSGASSKGMLAEWKIDYRDPTADRRLVEFSLRVPAEQLIHGGQSRALIKKVLADRAPAAVLDNPRKGYQAADWHEWLDAAHAEII